MIGSVTRPPFIIIVYGPKKVAKFRGVATIVATEAAASVNEDTKLEIRKDQDILIEHSH